MRQLRQSAKATIVRWEESESYSVRFDGKSAEFKTLEDAAQAYWDKSLPAKAKIANAITYKSFAGMAGGLNG